MGSKREWACVQTWASTPQCTHINPESLTTGNPHSEYWEKRDRHHQHLQGRAQLIPKDRKTVSKTEITSSRSHGENLNRGRDVSEIGFRGFVHSLGNDLKAENRRCGRYRPQGQVQSQTARLGVSPRFVPYYSVCDIVIIHGWSRFCGNISGCSGGAEKNAVF